MKTLVLLLIALLLVTFVAGCASKVTENSVTTFDKDSSSAEKISSSPEAKMFEGTAKEIYPDAEITPSLEILPVETNSHDLVLEKLEVIDNRDYEKSDKWAVRATMKYTGDEPALIYTGLSYMGGWKDEKGVDKDMNMIISNKGAEFVMQIDMQGRSLQLRDVEIERMKLVSYVHKKEITPEISSDFKNLKIGSIPWSCIFIDVKSVSLVPSEQNPQWNTVVVDLQQIAPMSHYCASCRAHLIGADGKQMEQKDGNELEGWANFGIGKTDSTVKIDLGTISPDEIYEIKLVM